MHQVPSIGNYMHRVPIYWYQYAPGTYCYLYAQGTYQYGTEVCIHDILNLESSALTISYLDQQPMS